MVANQPDRTHPTPAPIAARDLWGAPTRACSNPTSSASALAWFVEACSEVSPTARPAAPAGGSCFARRSLTSPLDPHTGSGGRPPLPAPRVLVQLPSPIPTRGIPYRG